MLTGASGCGLAHPRPNRARFDGFYCSKAWRMARRQQLLRHPLCQYELEDGSECGLLADSVHHIVELEDGGAPRDPANLMSCCRSHHSVIHAQRRGGKVA
jgi:5-methylcytosine-specific restriction endonuclease McrA